MAVVFLQSATSPTYLDHRIEVSFRVVSGNRSARLRRETPSHVRSQFKGNSFDLSYVLQGFPRTRVMELYLDC